MLFCCYCRHEIERDDLVTLVAIDTLQFKDGPDGAFDNDDLREFGERHTFDRCLCTTCSHISEAVAFAAKQYLLPSEHGAHFTKHVAKAGDK